MQRPTLTDVKIRSTRDALLVFSGVARKVLPLITRRLDAEERRAIVPGNVYVWEERGANTESTGIGMERWTDGMGWGPSRVRDEFLFYHQKEFELGEDSNAASTPWAQMMSVYPASHSRLASDAERLIKQTYSVHVSLPPDRSRGIIRKWHLTAYFSQQKLDGLATLDTVPGIGDVDIPDGWFKSARAGKSRRDHRDTSTTTTNTSASATAKSNSTPPTDLHLHHHPSPVSHHQHHQHRPHNSSSSSTTSNHHRASRYPHRTYKDETSHSPPSDHFLSPKQQSPILGALPLGNSGRLVPLQYLQAVAYPRRDPADEQLLKRFSTHSPSSCSHIRQSSHPCGL